MSAPKACVIGGCPRRVVSDWSWRFADAAQRETWREQEVTPHKGGGLCSTHYYRQLRTGSPFKVRPGRSRGSRSRGREDVLEEWVLLRQDGVTDLVVAAERMGMSHSALEQALYRARRRGDSRGRIYTEAELSQGRAAA